MKISLLAACLVASGGVVLSARAADDPAAKVAVGLDFLYGDRELFPSALVSLTGSSPVNPRDDQLGDPQGVMAVRVTAPRANSTIRVTVAETAFFSESEVAEVLPEAGKTYRIAPTLRYDDEKLAAQKQPIANLLVRVTVELNGAKQDIYEKLVVHSVNDWPLEYRPRDARSGTEPRPFSRALLTAFVNENNPLIDQTITKRALATVRVNDFQGYTAAATGVQKKVEQLVPALFRQSSIYREISGVYNTMQGDWGFHFADLGQPSLSTAGRASLVNYSHVRLMNEILASHQGNAVECATLLAAVYRRMTIDVVIYLLPEGKTLLGIYTAPGKDAASLIVIDPALLCSGDFEAAWTEGKAQFEKVRDRFIADDGSLSAQALQKAIGETKAAGYYAIDLGSARLNGVLPVPEARR